MKKKKIVFDMFLNIVASAIPTVCLQLLILPLLATKMSDERYGLLVTILALLNVVPSTLGNVLNNIRLLKENDYNDNHYMGDFNPLLTAFSAMNLIVVAVVTILYDDKITVYNLLLVLVVSVLWLAREYYIVTFRLKIDYKSIMVNNILQAVGYGIGYIIFLQTNCWQFIYMLGYICSLIHITLRGTLWKEPFKITPLFKSTTIQSTMLFVSNLLNRIITYADKILIYPILGGEIVAIYYTATVFGKVIALVITPINSVALTYLSKIRKKTNSIFNWALLIGAIVCALGYIACVIISKPVLGILYPKYVDEAMKYIFITTGTIVTQTMISIINPFILKFYDMKWQIIINGATVVVYIVLCMCLLNFLGLYGFCIGALLTNIIKLIFMLTIYYKFSASGETIKE